MLDANPYADDLQTLVSSSLFTHLSGKIFMQVWSVVFTRDRHSG